MIQSESDFWSDSSTRREKSPGGFSDALASFAIAMAIC